MCLAARLHALAGMQELVLPPHFGRDGTGMTLRTRPALARRGKSRQNCSKALALFNLGQSMSQGSNRPLHPHPLCSDRTRVGPGGTAGSQGSFLFPSLFLRKAPRAKKLTKPSSPAAL